MENIMLDQERKYFEIHREEWDSLYHGKFALVKGENLIGIFEKAEEALAEGARLYGKESFLVRQMEESEQLVYIPALTLGLLRADSTHPV